MNKDYVWENAEEYHKYMRTHAMTQSQMVREFMVANGLPVDVPMHNPCILDQYDFWEGLIKEEHQEVLDSETTVSLAKEIADNIYVLLGLANACGINIDEVFRRVHISNMSKLDDDGKPIKNEAGKVMKGPNYKPPVLDDLV